MRPPTLAFLIGPPAVGKMTVGQELERLTGFRLFHLHQIVDLLTQYFPFESPHFEMLLSSWRTQFFNHAADFGVDLITTGSWQFESATVGKTFERYAAAYTNGGGRVFFVELLASLETCLERNRTENRRAHKKTDWATDDYLRENAALHRYDSGGALPFDLPLLRLDTEGTTADSLAEAIRAHFDLPLLGR